MKKLFHTILFIYCGILFYSCSRVTDCSITKRHFRNGYYIETCSSNKNYKNTKETALFQNRNNNPEKISSMQISEQNEINQDPPLVIMNEAEKGQNEVATNVTINRQIKKTKFLNKTKQILGSVIKVNTPLKRLSENLVKIKKTNAPAQEEGRTGYSLLWILIVAILILWLFGFLAGGWIFGDLIHLLLIIALILAILWLLRVL